MVEGPTGRSFLKPFMQRALVAELLAILTISVVGMVGGAQGYQLPGRTLAHGVLPGIALTWCLLGGWPPQVTGCRRIVRIFGAAVRRGSERYTSWCLPLGGIRASR